MVYPFLPYREPNILYALNAALGIPKTISGICAEDIPVMAKHADKEGNPLYPVPILMNAKELEIFYRKIADWSVVCI